jgi:hypothetical protein
VPGISFLEIIFLAVVSGLTGTLAMTSFMTLTSQSGFANADMIRAIGSLFTKSLKNSFKTGLIIQTVSGVIFALFYTIIITSLNLRGVLGIAGAGTLIGFFHGAVVAFMLVTAVAERHPLHKFQQAGFTAAFIHWAAHVFYGLAVGLMIGFIGY